MTEHKNTLNEVTGGMKRGELNYLFAKTDPKKSQCFTAISTIAKECELKGFKLSEEEALEMLSRLKPFIGNREISFSDNPGIQIEGRSGDISDVSVCFCLEDDGSVKVDVTRKEITFVGEMKLFIFDYFSHAKPGVVFASNKEEAIKLIKEAGVTGLPDSFYSSVKEIEIPVDPTYVRYNSGE